MMGCIYSSFFFISFFLSALQQNKYKYITTFINIDLIILISVNVKL